MSRAAADLPDDPAELRRLASGLQHDVVVLEAAMAAQALLVEKLKHQLALLRRARFGRSSEKLDAQIEQFELLIGDLEETAAEVQATRSQTATPMPAERKPSVRAPLPSHLPTETVVHEAPCVCPTCGGTAFAGSARTNARCWTTCRPASGASCTSVRR